MENLLISGKGSVISTVLVLLNIDLSASLLGNKTPSRKQVMICYQIGVNHKFCHMFNFRYYKYYKCRLPAPTFLIMGVFWGVTQFPQNPVLTAPFPFPKNSLDHIEEDAGSFIAPSIMKSQYGIGVRQAVSILKKKKENNIYKNGMI